MNKEEWESLCDGCGRCCLHKLEDEDTGEIHYTAVACRYLDLDSCRCQCYAQRLSLVPDCIQLTAQHLPELTWLPATCAYRKIAEGKPLDPWHPLLSGDRRSLCQASIPVSAYAVTEEPGIRLEAYLINLDNPSAQD